MMCADLGYLADEVDALVEAGVDGFHMDFMDGTYVPNFSMGLQDLEYVRKATDKLVDVHLMIQNPSRYIELFAGIGVDIIYIHPDSDIHPARTLDDIRAKGVKAGIAINPGTSLESVKELFPLCDYVMVMTVNPGFAGQTYLSYVDDKIKRLIEMQKNYSFDITVDGAISPERIKTLGSWGVKGFILGTSALFGKEESYKELVQSYKA